MDVHAFSGQLIKTDLILVKVSEISPAPSCVYINCLLVKRAV